MSPTRGFAIELATAITTLLASRLHLPVSTTHCVTGATIGAALMNFALGATNWRQLCWISLSWVLILPDSGLVSGILTVTALNTPYFWGICSGCTARRWRDEANDEEMEW